VTVLVLNLTPALAGRLVETAERLGVTREDLARLALVEFLRAEMWATKTREKGGT